MDEVKIVPSWMDEQKITMPLTEFLAMKIEIINLENEIKDLKKEVSEQRSMKWDTERAYDKLKADYQKLLGIEKEGDDGK